LQALPEFESPGTDGEKGAKSKHLNCNTSIHGFKGSTFLEVFFEALKNITIEKEGFTVDSHIWDRHFHGLGCKKEIVPLQFIQFAKKLNEKFVLTAQSVESRMHFKGDFHCIYQKDIMKPTSERYKKNLTCAKTCFPVFSNLVKTKHATFLSREKQECSVTLEPISLLVEAIMLSLLMKILIHGCKMF
jgi:hypothetical protein